jgi:hypothetical protein
VLSCSLLCSTVLWRALACSGVLWLALACIDVLWHALACSGVHWRALVWIGVLWRALACSGVHWRALACTGVLWRALACSCNAPRSLLAPPLQRWLPPQHSSRQWRHILASQPDVTPDTSRTQQLLSQHCLRRAGPDSRSDQPALQPGPDTMLRTQHLQSWNDLSHQPGPSWQGADTTTPQHISHRVSPLSLSLAVLPTGRSNEYIRLSPLYWSICYHPAGYYNWWTCLLGT